MVPLLVFLLITNRDVVEFKSVVNVDSEPNNIETPGLVPTSIKAVCPVEFVLIKYKPKLENPVSTSSPGCKVYVFVGNRIPSIIPATTQINLYRL